MARWATRWCSRSKATAPRTQNSHEPARKYPRDVSGPAPSQFMKSKAFRLAPRRVDVDKALALHRAGRLDEARRLYEHILDADPRNASLWHFLGVLHHQS